MDTPSTPSTPSTPTITTTTITTTTTTTTPSPTGTTDSVCGSGSCNQSKCENCPNSVSSSKSVASGASVASVSSVAAPKSPQELAYERYRNSKTRGTMVSVDPRALDEDFVTFVNSWVSRSPSDVSVPPEVNPSSESLYRELLSDTFTTYYEATLRSRGPSIQAFQISDVSSQYEFDMYSLTNPRERTVFERVTFESTLESLTFWNGGMNESLRFTKMVSPLGVECWKFEHNVGTSVKSRNFCTLFLTKIEF